ncbi:MAG: hypothetical protein LBK62_11850 [Treponema sp.]|jgi:hypothetical protein|nr:hypothetical protein [Treponema sp.]
MKNFTNSRKNSLKKPGLSGNLIRPRRIIFNSVAIVIVVVLTAFILIGCGTLGGVLGQTLPQTAGIDNTGRLARWPDATRWAYFGLSGLSQPSGTLVESIDNRTDRLGVNLSHANIMHYENLLNQTTLLLVSAKHETPDIQAAYRRDTFEAVIGTNLITVDMEFRGGSSDILITVYRE